MPYLTDAQSRNPQKEIIMNPQIDSQLRNFQKEIMEKAMIAKNTLKIKLPLNLEGNIESIGPISGMLALAQRRDFDCEVELYTPSDVPSDNAPEVTDHSAAGDYSTDNYNDDDIPSIMSEAFASAKACDPIKEAHEIYKDDMRANACWDEAARERWKDDQPADAAAKSAEEQFNLDSLLDLSEVSSPEVDFQDEPNRDGSYTITAEEYQGILKARVPEESPVEEKSPESFENTQTVTDDVLLNARQVAKVLFGNDSQL
jgi:hypothetical protein